MAKPDIFNKIERWHIVVGFVVMVIGATTSGVFFALDYFETKENAEDVECRLTKQDRILELTTELTKFELNEFRLSNQIWQIEQQDKFLKKNNEITEEVRNLMLSQNKDLRSDLERQRAKIAEKTSNTSQALNNVKNNPC